MTTLRAGFIPLVDSAVMIVAAAKGFAREEGLTLELTREASWATLRDKLSVGAVDCAHLLAPITVASKLGLGNPKPPLVAVMSLSMNGNAVSVSKPLFDEMAATGKSVGPDDVAGKARALAAVIAARAAAGAPKLVFAVVYPFSPHTYELRYLLASAGIDPDSDVELVVVPPPHVVDHLEEGLIDGFCVGAPWTSVGIARGATRVIAAKPQIWRLGPEKVLGLRENFVSEHPDVVAALIRAGKRAAEWADHPSNHPELAALLAQPDVLGVDKGLVADVLGGRIVLDDGEDVAIPDYIVFDRYGATFPWRSHALWYYSQMVRWGQAEYSLDGARLAASAYRPDLYRAAFSGKNVTLPSANAKLEGALSADRAVGSTTGKLHLARDEFFDGRIFDPDDVPAYVAGFDVRHRVNGKPR